MASQIQQLLLKLGIRRATLFGCSSGGLAVIALIAAYPELVTCGIIHEVPFQCPEVFAAWQNLSDEDLTRQCIKLFATMFNEDEEKWNALGTEYHRRLSENYITWMRHAVNRCEDAGRQLATVENLNKRPLFWTVGSLNPGMDDGTGLWALDFELAKVAGLHVDTTTLKCLHFPAVSVTNDTARWIDSCIKQVRQQ